MRAGGAPRLPYRLRVLLLAIVSGVAAPAPGAVCTSTASCLAAIDGAQAATRTVSARFVQTKHVSLLDEPIVSKGQFYLARPDRMRLEVEEPQPATIVINGRDISIPGLPAAERNALAASPMAAMFTELGALFAGSTAALQRHFSVDAHETGGRIELTLTPTDPEWRKLFRTIVLRFTPPDMTIQAMRLDDALGDRLEIEMQDVRRNQPLPDSLFRGDTVGTR